MKRTEQNKFREEVDRYVDELYEEEMRENPDVYDKIVENVVKEAGSHDNKKKRWPFLKRLSLCAAMIVVVFVAAVIVVDIPEVRAFKSGVQESLESIFGGNEKEAAYGSLEELNEKRGMELPTLHYVPDGYALDGTVLYSEFGDVPTINMTYKKDEAYIVIIIQGLPDTDANSDRYKVDDYEYIEEGEKVIALSEKPPYSAAIYIGFNKYSIDASLSREEILKIAENIY